MTTLTGATRRVLGWAALALVILVALAFAQTDVGQRSLLGAGLTSRPQTTTELFFDPRQAEWSSSVPGDAQSSAVSFFVGNISAELRDVSWQVLTESPEGARLQGEGMAVTLAPGERRAQTAQVQVECRSGAITVVVRIPGEPVEITHRVACPAEPDSSNQEG